jgi:hypothetical protein
MRSIFAIWSDNGRLDYGIAPSRLGGAVRRGIAIVALAVTGMGIWNIYSETFVNYISSLRDSANQDWADTNRDVVNAAAASATSVGRPPARSPAAKRRVQPSAIGLALLGAPDRSAIAEPAAGSAANPAIAPADRPSQAAPPSDRGVAKLEENKPEELKPDKKSRVAKKRRTHSAPAVQVYQLPDGRQVVVRGQANGVNLDLWGNSFANVTRSGRRVQAARPWF